MARIFGGGVGGREGMHFSQSKNSRLLNFCNSIQLNKKNIEKQFALNGVCCRNWDFRKISSN